jgi:hypothetical protein
MKYLASAKFIDKVKYLMHKPIPTVPKERTTYGARSALSSG